MTLNVRPGRRFLFVSQLILATAYGAGMFRDLREPWIGLHDWNGAFYSQLARNFLRYPFEVHRGIPLVAVGAELPPPEDRCLYSTHPAGLVWLLAAVFGVVGPSEAAARSAAIAASIASLLIWFHLVRRRYDRETALLAGIVFAILPMTVYFGRMVNHEPFCLLALLAALACWQPLGEPKTSAARRVAAGAGWCAAIAFGMAIDWPGFLVAALFGIEAVRARQRRRLSSRLIVILGLWTLAFAGLVVGHLVYAGLGGSWSDLWAIFLSRTGELDPGKPLNAARHTQENLTYSAIVLCLIGGLHGLLARRRTPGSDEDAPCRERDHVRGLWIPAAVGSIWLLVFWRQYHIHHYWAFYLGPSLALLTAFGLQTIIGLTRPAPSKPLPGAIVAAALLVVVFVECRLGTDRFFAVESCPAEYVAAWKAMHHGDPAETPLRLGWNPIHVSRFGGYAFRNIVPPQLAYYLDRPIAAPE